MSGKMRILVLCTGNSCRSQIAEGLFRHYGGGQVGVYSAGLEPKGVNPRAVQVMREIGIDIAGHTSDHLSQYLERSFDFVITVCDNAATNCPVFPGAATKLHWPFADPANATGSEEEITASFRSVRDHIELTVKRWLSEALGRGEGA
ncbi:MAG: arsenate reductase ArsC [candidate division Zixibacteria bacterium]|nr:arsenate reductase ArsC [candidate division Zixibacteria bacterium]